LEEAYEKLKQQQPIKGNNDGLLTKKMLMGVDKLEDGVKEAIYSNFELLKSTYPHAI
jgi:hypothetical protein